ncbi:MAG: UDP-4-amino-4,6-dideoxy-N-acetyl-beta-L-altrosamine transaminase [Candidatus Margulisiibacteriota bacterium]|nr:MAG: UDP-4-amino-4,6-dideoxy-N-acetyl-beta-L-altrosamine transaminase [Candidatus Margulisbacteria bacterium GWD2_39_127]OGI00979.1 MAG: UDP-4-amino-4,6-dideoxy-N-acetyl-beta-L-altrosamine transaminase [Candidatus Margulisbacteria bacterium GWF2_38_17]OGI08048.1 MAG: UDP-4-amino-4,6-dideoxy-N-acetyl-beta-L-altrosamine transaminase [Candidatus Margulisbacteria bacterium GWE2_39_32]PZM82090.1 MAG: UDP-4-amino-4,6-dideoxy-N-acetyl-beta-L-altrosamine transaminase [Candidatus Margulisiibacteriota 
MIPFHKAHITDDEINGVIEAVRSGWLTMGPKTIEFEKKFGEYIGVKNSVSMNSATAALHLALKAIGLKAEDEVIIPTNTFIATAEVITYFNAIPVLCDIEPATHNIDSLNIEKKITKKTKAIIPVHFAGQPCDMDEIMSIAKDNNLKVIEDAAHAIPASYKNQKIGTIGDITCFSFYATKTLATGEGGMATTDNDEYAKHMKINRLHGISRDAWDRYTAAGSWYYEVIDNGNKYNTTDINSALGLAQLKKVEWMQEQRAKIAAKYTKAFTNTKIVTPVIKNNRTSAWHLYVIKVANRDELIEKLKDEGIGTSVHFIPVHRHPYYKNTYDYKQTDYPVAEDIFLQSLSLPIYPGMTDEDIDRVINKVIEHAK